jgi:D-threonate/D-erythronate kinase
MDIAFFECVPFNVRRERGLPICSLRLLADDLTGGLDTSAEFVGICGPFDVTWTEALPAKRPPCLAIDTGTRECDRVKSTAIVESLVPLLREGSLAYKKVDSLLRGPWAAELATCLRSGLWSSCIIAPAFPYQGRRTLNGQQYVRAQNGGWSVLGANLLAQLESEGINAGPGRFDADLTKGVHVFDAESDDDLDRVAAIGCRASQPILWCGSGGLAGALARGGNASVSSRLSEPVLGLFGSDHPVTAAQLAACGPAVITVTDDDRDNAARVQRKLAAERVALVRFDLAPGLVRAEATLRIARTSMSLVAALDPPGTLIVAGGETLRRLCVALGATALRVTGRIKPGLPRSVIQGGRWAGVDVISKSGAFGEIDLWRTLLSDNERTIERHIT